MQHTDELPATSYRTGYTPKMTYHQLVAHVNARSHFVEDLATQHDGLHRAPRDKLSKDARRMLKIAKMLEDLQCLRDLVKRDRVPVLIHGELYGVKRTKFGWSLLSLDGHERQLNVNASSCSCEDNRFRNRTCKHMEALKCFCHPA